MYPGTNSPNPQMNPILLAALKARLQGMQGASPEDLQMHQAMLPPDVYSGGPRGENFPQPLPQDVKTTAASMGPESVPISGIGSTPPPNQKQLQRKILNQRRMNLEYEGENPSDAESVGAAYAAGKLR